MARKRDRFACWLRREEVREGARVLVGALGALSRIILAIAVILSG